MFWKEKESGTETPKPKSRLHGPQGIPTTINVRLVVDLKVDPGYARELKAVIKPDPERGKDTIDFRIYDPGQAKAKELKVVDYTSFDDHQDLILFEGWFDQRSNKVEVERQKMP